MSAIERPPADAALYVVDDEPLRMRDFATLLAGEFRTSTGSAPRWLGALMAGRPVIDGFTASCRTSNARARSALSWSPTAGRFRDNVQHLVTEYRELLAGNGHRSS